ncbi:sodium:solute symporter family protein [Tengunoibacter tsumagoiensis]|uniref:Sodium:solute symporter n=1 Tax=Tengunoibacter tsumagoiensis TaxID=2014871 RepID=A0A401ZY25_9CHLR|nr:sodium:solute symporter family protein [Tengunoibacter tsumagoiensis]GCE11747.1 sodium:solute symporter [Tengunoibacter tsumagoiensis]
MFTLGAVATAPVTAHVQWVDYLIIGVYFLVTLGIGLILRRKMKSSEDFFLSGRSLPSWVTGLAFVGANLGALEILGMGAAAAQYGMMQAHFYWIGAIPAMLFVAIFMMPFYYGSKAHSVPGFLKLRYNEATRGFNAITFGILTLLTSGINMYAAALVFNVLLGWSLDASIWLAAVFIMAYILLGGLTSSIYNETLQFFLIVAGLLPLTIIGLLNVGGWSGLQERVNNPAFFHLWINTAGNNNPFGVNFIGIALGLGFVLSFGYWCTDFLVVQRALAAEDEAAAERTPLIAAFPKLFFPFLAIIPGLVVLTVFPQLGKTPGFENSFNMAIPYAMVRYLPNGLLGLGLTALLAAFMSGMAGNVTAFNTVWTYDIYRAYIKRDASDRHYLNMGRIVTVVGIILSVGTAYIAASFTSIMDYVQALFSVVNAPLLATFLLGMFWKRTTAWGGFFGVVIGTLVALFLWIGETVYHLFSFGSSEGSSMWRALIGWGVCFVVTIIISLFTKPKPDEELKGLVYSLTPKRTAVETVWYKRPIVLASIALVIFIIFNLMFF